MCFVRIPERDELRRYWPYTGLPSGRMTVWTVDWCCTLARAWVQAARLTYDELPSHASHLLQDLCCMCVSEVRSGWRQTKVRFAADAA